MPDSQRDLLRRLAWRVVPESADLPRAVQDDMLGLLDQALAARPAGVRRQFRFFLGVLRWAPVLRYGSRLDHLAPSRQDAVLRWFQDAPVQLIRSGFWGVRTLLMMSYYGRPETAAAIGYHPSEDGNAVLHARTRR